MSNYIDFQLTAVGNRNTLEQLQNLIVSVNNDRDEYKLNLNALMMGKLAVISKSHSEDFTYTKEELTEFYILEEFVNDFEFEFYEKLSYYEWHGKGKGANLCIWNDEYWQRLTINEHSIILNGTSKVEPPIVHVIAASRLFPDLNLKLSFVDTTGEIRSFGSIEGKNGQFSESNTTIEYKDILNNKLVYSDGFGNWFYADCHGYMSDDRYIERFAIDLFDKIEPNYSYGSKTATKVVIDYVNKKVFSKSEKSEVTLKKEEFLLNFK